MSSRIVTSIKNAFHKHPIIANSLLYGAFFVSAEFSQQTITRKFLADEPEPYDTDVIKKYVLYGPTIQGPLLAFWYKWLDSKFVGTAVKVVIPKLLVDQFVFTPNLLVIFFVSMSIMENKNDLLDECKQKFIPTFKTSCLFWLPVQTVNFFLVPPVLRVAYVGACSFAWVNILCYIKRQRY